MQKTLTLLFTFITLNAFCQLPQQGGCVVTFNIPGTTSLCSSQNVFMLPSGNPSGGTLSGPGVFDGLFFPSLAGVGEHVITYSYDDGFCAGTATDMITVVAPEPIELSGDFEICLGESTTITALNGNDVEWSDNSTGNEATFTPTETDIYTVYAYDDNNCLSSEGFAITVDELPDITIIGNTDVCEGESAFLTALGIVTYNWSTGGSEASVEFFPETNTTACVTGTDENGCSNTQCVDVILHEDPIVQIMGDTEICAGETTILQGFGATQFEWSTGSFASQINVTPGSDQIITVVGFDGYGCQGSAQTTIVVNENPVAAITGELELCAGESTTLTATGADEVVWSNSSINATETFSPLTSQLITVEVTNELGCTDEAEVEVVVHQLPEVMILGETTVCEGGSVQLMGMSAAIYMWSNGSSEESIVFEMMESETIGLIGTDEFGCSNSAEVITTALEQPEVNVSGDNQLCEGETTGLTAEGAEQYEWSTGATDESITLQPMADSTVSVIGYAENGCSNEASITVFTFSASSIELEGDITPCAGDSVMYTVVGGVSYEWSTGSVENFILLEANEDETITVSMTNEDGCAAATTFDVEVQPLPVITISGDDEICYLETAVLEASGAADYEWSSGDVGAIASIIPFASSTWFVFGTDANGCNGQAEFFVEVHQLPFVEFYLEEEIICDLAGPLALAGSPAGGEFSGAGVANNVFSPSTDLWGNQTITYTYTDEFGCTAESSDVIVVDDCSGIAENSSSDMLLYPNPTATILSLQWNRLTNGVVSVFDSNGKLVLSQKTNGTHSFLNVSHIPSGIYLLQWMDASGHIASSRFEKL